MKTIYFLSVAALIMFFGACEKPASTFGTSEVNVTVELYDNLADFAQTTRLKNQKVYIRFKDETTCLFEATTDDNGQATFSYLLEGENYVVYVEYEKDGIPYKGEKEFIASEQGIETLTVSANTAEFNGFRIKCVDGQGAAIPSVDICLFESQTVAMTADCSVSTLSGSSSVYGVYMETRIAARNYYISIVDTVGGIPIGYQDSILVNETGVTEKEIVVIP